LVSQLTQKSLTDRFPHLRHEIHDLTETDPGFRQLYADYKLLTRSIQDICAENDGDLQEMITLKTSLEVEALELLSRVSSRR